MEKSGEVGGEQEHPEKGGDVDAEVEDEETGSGGGEAGGAGDAKGEAVTYVPDLFWMALAHQGGALGMRRAHKSHLADSLFLHLV